MSGRIYPNPSSLGINLFSLGGSIEISSLDIWRLENIWNK